MTTPTITDLPEYLQTGYAQRHRGEPVAAAHDPMLESQIATLQREGFLVLERLFPAETVDAMRRDLQPLLPQRGGRNIFEGLRTQRVYGIIGKTLACNALVEHPRVLALLDQVLERNYLLSQLQAINILPGEAAQPLHYDDGFYPLPRPRPPLGAATILALHDFTPENGATVVIPGSHAWDDHAPTAEEQARTQPICMPRGSVVLFLGTLWHGGGANRSAAARLALTAQYCAPWARQQENFSLSVTRERVRECSSRMQALLGYSIHPPFMGMVNGMHPLRVLKG